MDITSVESKAQNRFITGQDDLGDLGELGTTILGERGGRGSSRLCRDRATDYRWDSHRDTWIFGSPAVVVAWEMVSAAIRTLVEGRLRTPDSGWSMGSVGAIADFVRDADDPVVRTSGSAVVARGGSGSAVATVSVAYETPAGPGHQWNHAVALRLSAADAGGATRRAAGGLMSASTGPTPDFERRASG